jgi:hypothetical protein
MNPKQFGRKPYLTTASIMLCALIAVSGCVPLKKKFTRAKKTGEEKEIIPILEPIEYPAHDDSPEALYKQAYSLWKIWHRELTEKINAANENEKYIEKLFIDDIQQLGKMKAMLREDNQPLLNSSIEEMRKALEEYSEPEGARNYTVIKRILRSVDKEVRNSFSPEMAELAI